MAHELGSGIEGPLEPATTAKSPSSNVGESVMVAENAGFIVTVEPSFSVRLVVLKVPVRVAESGMGLVPPMAMGLPSNDCPSRAVVKYDEPNV